jgi:hypothetical protein
MITITSPSTVLAVAEPVFSNAEGLSLSGFLAGYSGLTREAYAPGPAPVRVLVPAAPCAPVRCAPG